MSRAPASLDADKTRRTVQALELQIGAALLHSRRR